MEKTPIFTGLFQIFISIILKIYKYNNNSMFQYLLDAFYCMRFRKKIRDLHQNIRMARSVIGFTYCPTAFIEYILDVQKALNITQLTLVSTCM